MSKAQTKMIVKIDMDVVIDMIQNSRKRQGELMESEITMFNRMIAYMEYIQEQLDKGITKLDLNDALLAEELNCTEREAKRAKDKLSKLNLIFVPAWARQKKEGDYPVWFMNHDYCVKNFLNMIAETVKNTRKKIRKYVNGFYVLWNLAASRVVKFLDEMEAYHGVRPVLSGAEFGMLRNQEMNIILEDKGLTRADFLK